MDYRLFIAVLFSSIVIGNCEQVKENVVQPARAKVTIRDFIPCARSRNVACLFDKAEDFLTDKKKEVLDQADAEALLITGRADKDHKPSALVATITKMIEELTGMFSEGLSSFFKQGKEADGNDEVEDENEDDEEDDKSVAENNKGRALSESRKKKKGKIHKLIAAIKFLVGGGALTVVIGTLLKIFNAHLQVKFLLIALAGLALNAARFWLDIKKGHAPQKVIYYEHAQHQHHYEGDEEYGGHSGPGEYWGRAYDIDEEKLAQEKAYAKQKPYGTEYSKVDNKPNFSWFG